MLNRDQKELFCKFFCKLYKLDASIYMHNSDSNFIEVFFQPFHIISIIKFNNNETVKLTICLGTNGRKFYEWLIKNGKFTIINKDTISFTREWLSIILQKLKEFEKSGEWE